MASHKKIIIVGLTGSGKSTTSNSLLNRSGELIKLQTPFTTSDGTAGCTLHFQQKSANNITILDTVGFGDPQFEANQILNEFKTALKEVGNKVTHVIFVVRKGRFSNETVNFFRAVQEQVLKNKCFNNSFLLFTDAPKGWVNNQTDQFFKKALQNCNGQYYEYSLRFDRDDDDKDEKINNIKKRQKAIDEFSAYIEYLNFQEIDLAHVQTAKFEDDFNNNIVPELMKIMQSMIAENNKLMREIASAIPKPKSGCSIL